MMEAGSPPSTTAESGVLRKVIVGGAVGNVVEWYDFAIYGYMATAIATNFFPVENRTVSLLATFAVFGVAFFFRPLGGIVMGPIGDKIGRRSVLAVVILIMSGATAVIGLLPTYEQIGIFAPILLVAVRSIQGFSAGGEYAGATSFVVEYSPDNRRAYLASFLSVSTYASFMFGAVLAAVLSAGLSEEALNSWGWRIPFLIGAPLGLIGLYIRLRLEDTPAFRAVESAGQVPGTPLRETLRNYYKPILLLLGFLLSNAVGPYLLVTYIPTYLRVNVGMGSTAAFVSNIVALAFLLALLPVFGFLSDRFGRKPIMLASTLLFASLSVPAFLLLGQGGIFLVILGQLLIVLAQAASNSVTAVAITELFPTRVRYSSAAISYNMAYVLVGGTAPFVATFLVAQTGNPLAPAFYMVAIALVSTIFVFALPETYKAPLVREGDVRVKPSAPASEGL